MSLSVLLVDPRWVLVPVVHSPYTAGLHETLRIEGAGQNSAECEAFRAGGN